jgi:ribosomal-protein-alanine N-acetyltransferase
MVASHPGWPAVLTAGALTLRPPRRRDAREWSRVRIANEGWLSKWESTSSQTWMQRNSVAEYHRMLSRMRAAARAGVMLPFAMSYGNGLVGHITVSNLVRGSLRSCSVGYWVDSRIAGRGLTPTAVALVIDHCLGPVRLHRVEINIRPENTASLRVVEKLGLRQEGLLERLLDIDGQWRDHLSFAITSEEVRASTMLSRLSSLPVEPA